MDVSGRVIESFIEEGVAVRVGELLLRLDDRDQRLEVQEAEAEWHKIRAQYAVQYESEPGLRRLEAESASTFGHPGQNSQLPHDGVPTEFQAIGSTRQRES
ncbi:MAG: biotin/lipoyl-binding protein [Acidobacteriota bacterium]